MITVKVCGGEQVRFYACVEGGFVQITHCPDHCQIAVEAGTWYPGSTEEWMRHLTCKVQEALEDAGVIVDFRVDEQALRDLNGATLEVW